MSPDRRLLLWNRFLENLKFKKNLKYFFQEFKEALELTKKIMDDDTEPAEGVKRWAPLFTKTNFFMKYKHFIVLSATADDHDAYKTWYVTILLIFYQSLS